MKAYDFEAVTYDADVYCVGCLPDGVSVDDEEVGPIFADSEWDHYPVCVHCGTVHDYVSLTAEGRLHIIEQEAQEDKRCAMDVRSFDLIRVWEADGFRLLLFDTNRPPKSPRSIGETILAYRLFDEDQLIFEGSDFGPGAGVPIDSDRSVAALLGFLSCKPGDTDPEYFATYTPEQLAWCQDRAEDLSLIVFDMENPERSAQPR
jgi:hypothetical protein